ncbi:MAG: nuclease-related domain-containing protein [Candidatus Kariarchaeaceae archaeon]|jgi:hypothetical protein
MQIIDNQISDIFTAYKQIRAAENDLLSKWREPLLSVYASQREVYESELVESNKRLADFNRRIRLGIWMSAALLLLGFLILPGLILINELGDFRGPLFCFSPILILGGFTGWAIIVVLWIWQRGQEKPKPPQNPLKLELMKPLDLRWKTGLYWGLPSKKPNPGATGEYHFITRLQSLEDNSHILYGIQQRPGEDIDVILVGTIGIWIFEVKYLRGLIRWRDGIWTQIQSTRRFNRGSNYKVREADQPYEEQWQRAVGDVSETLRRRAPDLVKRAPKVTKIRGGIVFTHPKGRCDIPSGCPFNWGIVSFWLDKLKTFPNQEFMDDTAVMEILDALLTRHHQIADVKNPQSMIAYANSIIAKTEGGIRFWIDNNQAAID